jgi:hypothetical protein
MDAVALVEEARTAGLVVTVAGGRLVVRGPRRAADLAKRLLANKTEVLAALQAVPAAGVSDEVTTRRAAPTPREWEVLGWLRELSAGVDEAAWVTASAAAALVGPRDGWEPRAWRDRLLQMARSCEAANPCRAMELRRAAIAMTPAWEDLFQERAAIMELEATRMTTQERTAAAGAASVQQLAGVFRDDERRRRAEQAALIDTLRLVGATDEDRLNPHNTTVAESPNLQ